MTTQQLYQTALDLHRNGQLAQAETYYRQLLATQPGHADALHYLGLICYQTGRHAQAATLIAQALELKPDNAGYLNNYGAVLRAKGQLQDAIDIYLKALKLTPGDLDLQNNLGNAYLEAGCFEKAAGCYRRVLNSIPSNSDARAALCHALQSHGFECHAKGSYVQAEAAYGEAIRLHARDGALHYNLANAQRELGKPAEALKHYRQALKLLPDDADIYNNLGNVLRELGKLDEAVTAYQAALKLNSRLFHALVHQVHQKQHICDWSGLEQSVEKIRRWVREEPEAQVSPFAFLAMPATSAAEQKQCADNWVRQHFSGLVSQHAPFPQTHRQNGRIRIGYLSSDFRLHPLAFLITELIELHDRQRFEIIAYSYAADDKTAERRRLEKAFDRFVDIRPYSITAAAEKVYQDKIDILVDLTGFTQSSRSAIAALRPARINISWLGFPGTMGAFAGDKPEKPLFDYLLTDNFITPPDQAGHYAEKLLPLSVCYQPNDRKRPIADAPPRAQCGLPADAFQPDIQDIAAGIRYLDAPARGKAGERALAAGMQCARQTELDTRGCQTQYRIAPAGFCAQSAGCRASGTPCAGRPVS